MNKLLLTLLGASLASGAALAAAPTQQARDGKPSGTYDWLHPRLGMVKVDRATNFMVVAKRQPRAEPAGQAGAPASR